MKYLVATDKFLSGWGKAKGKSYVAYPLAGLSLPQIDRLESWMRDRGDYIRVRYTQSTPKTGPNNHLSIIDPPSHIIGNA